MVVLWSFFGHFSLKWDGNGMEMGSKEEEVGSQ